MKEYHKIKTVFERDPETKFKTLLENKYATPGFEYLRNNIWVFTEKVNGTNIRVVYDGKDIKFGGKTDDAQIPSFLLSQLMDMFLRGDLFKDNFPDGCCLHGEGYGTGIQKGGKYLADSCNFVLFDVKIGDWWLKRIDVDDVADKLNIKSVPVIGRGTLPEMVELCRGGFKSQWGDFQAEGIVARPRVELFDRNNKRIITKIKYKDFKPQEK